MSFVLLLAGAIVGGIVCGGIFDNQAWGAGVVFGAIAGLFMARWSKLRARVSLLEQQLEVLRNTRPAPAALPAQAGITTAAAAAVPAGTASGGPTTTDATADPTGLARAAPIAAASAPAPAAANTLAELRAQTAAAATRSAVATAAAPVSPAASPATPQPAASRATARREPDSIERAFGAVKRWFTEGNVPVKVGVLVLFAGVAALIKYATDQGWLSLPIELRLAGIALVALAALVFAWRKREQHRAFALSLQGGSIGILMMLVFSALRLYPLLSAPAAFALLVVLVAGTGVLAVLQDAIALAVLGIVGGFLAPILVSTGAGSHVVLFSYYALLNFGILGVAWNKPWRILNLLGFAFTFGIGIGWGVLQYQPPNLPTTLPFLLLFWAFYLLLPILYARRQAADRRDLIDATLVFGTPLIAFPLLAGLLHGERLTLAFAAVFAAAIYAGLAWLLLRRLGLRLLGEAHVLLALGFATLAVPLALSARSTACAWAVEGAALVWLGLRQQRRLPRWIGYALQLAAAASLALHFDPANAPIVETQPILNGTFFCALLISLAALVSARLLSRADRNAPLAHALFWWGLLWWYGCFGHEIHSFAPGPLQMLWTLLLITLSGGLAAELLRRFDWQDCMLPAALPFPLALPLLVLVSMDQHGPLEGYALPAWALWTLVALRCLACLQTALSRGLVALQFIFLWVLVLLLSGELIHLAHAHLLLAPTWSWLSGLIPFAAVFWLLVQRRRVVYYPLPVLAAALRNAGMLSFGAVLALAVVAGMFAEGRAAPLPYLPLLNPLELAQCLAALLLLGAYRQSGSDGTPALRREAGIRLLALFGFALLTSITLRSVHFLAGVAWDEHLFASTVAQASLSVVWSLAGIAAMLIGARRGARGIWIGGALLMGVVLVKLIAIDRQHLGDLPGIGSFLAVGLLLLVVGYFAPVPPRQVTPSAGATP